MNPRTALHFAANVLLAVLFAVAVGINCNTHTAPLGDYQGMGPAKWEAFKASRAHHPDNVPDWTAAAAKAYPRCEAMQEGVLYGTVVVVDSGNDTSRMTLDKAYTLNSNSDRADDVWVIGGCHQ